MNRDMYPDPETLYINRSDSLCGNCRKGADPYSRSHDRVLGYNPEDGCGKVWSKVSTMSYGMDINTIIAEMRPDLEVAPL